ncbi:nucleotide exchange factor GrpE [Prosthecochloris sp. GSB1]|uniref:nucleotide exchange factor GrpE n=1 Tax=Prosthecochloris sp. GSB1 TaxID=281093 RepID=UPI000B8CAB0C|nr:nucleotide exchange factor GrpE [Prosthecochloris sp. GSB1]ASQ90377.1 nucleotide exchange factor GrpE [Prosthecochloris sp. GSB1]
MSQKAGILQRLLGALKGNDGAEARAVAILQLDLSERDEEIARLRKEYALLRERSMAEVERAGGEALESIARQCAASLAALSAMQARHAEKGDLNSADLLQVASSFRKILEKHGLEQIGAVGREQPYDPALHQMLDGTRPQPGEPVLIRFAGFRFNGKLIAKAQAGVPESR